MNRTALCAMLGLLAALSACAPPAAQSDAEFQLRKVEQERDSLRLRLSSEQARSTALEQRLDTEQQQSGAARAEAGRLREQIDKLNQHTQELVAALERIRQRELTRPAVPASPLPPAADEALQDLAARLAGRVWYERDRGAVSFANDRLFDSGSDAVRPDAVAGLRELVAVLERPELADYEVVIVGHTDATPITRPETLARHPSNWHLSVHRAIAVKDVLAQAGFPAVRLGVMGYGDQRPISDDPARNRRVEVFIVRKGGVQPFDPIRPTGRR
ncbi:MAG: OmpA family protein [Planctomycetota bacterium]